MPEISLPPPLSCESVCESPGKASASSPSHARFSPHSCLFLSQLQVLKPRGSLPEPITEEWRLSSGLLGSLGKHLKPLWSTPSHYLCPEWHTHTHTHTCMRHLDLKPYCQRHSSPMFPQISINHLCLCKRN